MTQAYREIFEEAKADGMEPPQELNGDLEAAFKSERFQNMLRDQGTIWRPKTGNKRENLGNTAQLDSTIGRWREALRRERGGDERWFDYIPQATEAVNNKDLRPLRGATPAQALKDDENPLLRYTQSEKAFEDMQKSQAWADKKRGS